MSRDVSEGVPTLGGKSGELRCAKCNAKRWPRTDYCPKCWGEMFPARGTRNRHGDVIQAKLPREVWNAVNFAAHMRRSGQPFTQACRIAARHYGVSFADVQRGMAQRGGRTRKGRR